MANQRDKMNVPKQLLVTLIGTCGQPRCPFGYDKDPMEFESPIECPMD
jgi:hypothetical protein